MTGRWLRNSFIYLLILVGVIAIVFTLFGTGSGESKEEVEPGQFVADVRADKAEEIERDGETVTYKVISADDEKTFKFKLEKGDTVRGILEDAGIPIEEQPEVDIKGGGIDWFGIFINFLPLIIFGGLLIFLMRQAQGSNTQAMSFGKSKARLFTGTRTGVTFTDVAGVEEAKEELQEVVEFLKWPEKFIALGARIPRGVLLLGPPGTGKTLLAKAVAGEAAVPFFSISGSEFVEMFVGVGASRVRDLFDQAKRNSPCIVFIDEIDAVGRHRGAGLGGSHDEREQTLNQILVEMDGFDTHTNIIVVAATNRPDILDPALLRPGRFDRQVVLDRPDIKGRKAILDVHTQGKPLDKDVDAEVLAKQTPGFSGADLANLVNEAAILTARRNKKKVTMAEFEEAVDRVIAGPERKSRVISPKEKETIAYHEAGHALVSHVLPNADPVYKITIVSRGMTGGFTRFMPAEDRNLWTRSQFQDALAAILGGMVAEELVFGEMTTGPQDDLERATKIARQMVTQWGMSERLGPRTFGKREEMVFLGREISEQRNYSEKVAEEIDDEVRRIVDEAHQTASKVLVEKRAKLDQIAKHLIEVETIEGEALATLFAAPVDEELTTAEEPEGEPEQPKKPKKKETRAEPRIAPPEPGLAWGSETPARLDPEMKQE
ncbi:MAG: ATP-dependent zinc metalloprotease FtsH [Dehalococcoidia bacterium]|nr:MAG: ATP-dependent zinc metalloprotease FtsH [Dehalococcoidia bacterium]